MAAAAEEEVVLEGRVPSTHTYRLCLFGFDGCPHQELPFSLMSEANHLDLDVL